MSKDLRNKIIRLAHKNPELRKDLLPLLTEKVADKTAEWEEMSDREASSLAFDLVNDVYVAIQKKFGIRSGDGGGMFIDGDSKNSKIHENFVKMVAQYIQFESTSEDRTK